MRASNHFCRHLLRNQRKYSATRLSRSGTASYEERTFQLLFTEIENWIDQVSINRGGTTQCARYKTVC